MKGYRLILLHVPQAAYADVANIPAWRERGLDYGQPTTHYKPKWRNIRIRDVFCGQHLWCAGGPNQKNLSNLTYRSLNHISFMLPFFQGSLCRPALLEEDPALFFGFWGHCYNRYSEAEPHSGCVTRFRMVASN